jgi:hypothetical protein
MTSAVDATAASPLIRQMRESDIPIASAVFRRAFGTFLGLPDPDTFRRIANICGGAGTPTRPRPSWLK